MRVCVTGGCGFIGSHVADAYISEGHEVVVVDNLSTGKIENKNTGVRLHVADIRDEKAMEEIFREERFQIVNHHAAQISVPLSVQQPLEDAEINIKGTLRLLELSRKHGVGKFIFSSTGGAIYGEADVVPTDETYVPEPASPYAISKFSAEKYIRYYHHYAGLHYTILRYSNVFGPRQIPHGEAGVVAIFTERLLAGSHPILNHFPEEPRGMVRDYCFVKDIARASVAATVQDTVGIFNIGTGTGTHTLDLYRGVIEALREKGVFVPEKFNEPLREGARAGDITVSTLNTAKAQEVLRWEPFYDLKKGLLETVGWYLAAKD
jgi:UDP-glucose 4-epimerase